MKLFGFYITRINPKPLLVANQGMAEEIEKLEAELEKSRKNDTPRDPETGRYISKMKALHNKLRHEAACRKYQENQPCDNCALGHYDDAKKAGK